jgi:hypothetical protein
VEEWEGARLKPTSSEYIHSNGVKEYKSTTECEVLSPVTTNHQRGCDMEFGSEPEQDEVPALTGVVETSNVCPERCNSGFLASLYIISS